jgi:gliding motility-associated-like protein
LLSQDRVLLSIFLWNFYPVVIIQIDTEQMQLEKWKFISLNATRTNISEVLTLLVTDKFKNSGIKYAATDSLRAAAVLCIFILVATLSCSAQNSMVGDGFGGRLWYNPTNYTVGSYSAYSICSSEDCSGTNELYGWGGNSYGNLGFPLTTIGFDVPTAIPNMTDVKYYSCGYSMAAIKNDNTGWAWGIFMPSVNPTQVITDVNFADGGANYCSFVKNDGTIWSIGVSYIGEFGNGVEYVTTSVPVQMQGISNAIRVACGYNTTYVLLDDGTVRSTGSNVYGLLGIGSDQNNSTTPLVVPGLNNIIDIKANTYFTVALGSNGNVYAWGLFPDNTINNFPVQITSLTNIVAISGCTDGFHIFALDEAKNCYAWGTAFPEATGLPIGSGSSPAIVATDVIDILAGETFSYIVKSDGTLWAAGDSNGGSIWLNVPNETYFTPELYDGFVQLDPGLVPEACSVVSQIASTAYSCETAGTVDVVVTGGQAPYQYNIGNGNQTENVFTGLSPGEYAITITNAIGCESVLNAVVDDGGMNYPVPALGPNQQLCQGATMALDAGNAGATYLWSTGQTTQNIEVTDSGIYSVEVTMNGCTNEDELQVDFQELPVANLGNDFEECEGTITPLMAPLYTGATYLWSTGQTTQTIEASNTGIYSVEINWNGCTAEDEVQIEFLPMPIVNLGDDITQCEGAGINLTTPNYEGASYSWSNGQTTQSINANESGTYSVLINWNGCDAEDEIEIEILPLPVVNLGDEITQCEGTNINLITPQYEGASYSWNTGQNSQSIVVSESGIYSVVIDWNGCTSEDEVQIEFLPLPLVNLGDDITQCEGADINLTTPNYEGASYSWSNGQTTQSINANESGAYSVLINWNGCNAEDEIEIEILPLPVVNLGDEITLCEGTTATLNAGNEGATCLWSNGQTTQSINVTDGGTYSVEVNLNGCTSEDEVQIEFSPLPEFDLGNDIIQCRGIESLLEASHFEEATYTWSTGESEERILVTEYGNYWCTVMIGSCTYTDSIEFTQPVYQCFEPFTAIWVPNAFTPDKDGTNDVFGVYGGGISNEHFELNIYNRWGVLIWSTNQPDMKWTGNADNGEHYVPDGVYSYFVKYRFDNMNDDKTLAGHVTLIR